MTKTALATDNGDGDGWISTSESCKRLGITPRQLYQLIDSLELPAHRFGRVIQLRVADVEVLRVRWEDDPPEMTQ